MPQNSSGTMNVDGTCTGLASPFPPLVQCRSTKFPNPTHLAMVSSSDAPPFFQVSSFTIPASHIRSNPRATSTRQDETLHLCYKRYIPLNNLHPQPGDITLIAGHATGFPKELYEPLWEEICRRLDQVTTSGPKPRIRAIWMADCANHGASFSLNRPKLGDDPDWMDHSRDLLHFVNTHRSELPRPLFGIGHSMGANQIVGLSLLHPRLLEGIVLLDPVMQDLRVTDEMREGAEMLGKAMGRKIELFPFRASAGRKDRWRSRADAERSILQNAFYKRWDPRVLQLWLKYGLRNVEPTESSSAAHNSVSADDTDSLQHQQQAVTLSTPVPQEVQTFVKTHLDPHNLTLKHLIPHLTSYRSHKSDTQFLHPQPFMSLQSLARLRPRTLFIFGGRSPMSTPSLQAEKLSRVGTGLGGNGGIAGNGADSGVVQSVVLERVGHLVAMEDVGGCAGAVAPWLEEQWQRYRGEMREYEAWTGKPLGEKQGLSQEWLDAVAKL